MYQGNKRLRGENEAIFYTNEMKIEYRKCATDFEYWVVKYAMVATLDDGIRLITLRDYQSRMIKQIQGLKERDKRGMVVLAPRQSGKTLAIYLYLLWKAIFFEATPIAIIANKGKNSAKILRSIKQTYELLPLWMQCGLKKGGWNKQTVEFANESMIVTGSATSDSIRGGSFSVVYLDEYAFLTKSVSEEFMKSVLPTIMSGMNAQIFVTSTPKGMNQFYNLWKVATRGLGIYESFKVDWREVPNYNEDFKRQMIETEGLLYWKQEYECGKFSNIRIKNVKSGKIETLSSEELYERLEVESFMQYASMVNTMYYRHILPKILMRRILRCSRYLSRMLF